MLNVAYSKYMYCAVAVNIRQKIKNCAFTYFSKIMLQTHKKTDYALVPLLKIKGTKSIEKSPQFIKHHLISPAVHF